MRSIALVLFAIVLVWPVRTLLVRSRWTELTPRAAIVLWQAIGLAVGVAILGACFAAASYSDPGTYPRQHVTDFTAKLASSHPVRAVHPDQLFGLTAGLIVATLLLGSVVVKAVGLTRTRARHRMLIDLLSTEHSELSGAFVLDHPHATAFSLPGLRPRIVVSTGALDALQGDEVGAVLAHEQAHLRARHDLVLLPFRAFGSLMPRSRTLARIDENVTALIEMAADDRAMRQCDPKALVRALCRLSGADSSSLALGMTPSALSRRVERVLTPRRGAKLLVLESAIAALVVLMVPFVALFGPIGGR